MRHWRVSPVSTARGGASVDAIARPHGGVNRWTPAGSRQPSRSHGTARGARLLLFRRRPSSQIARTKHVALAMGHEVRGGSRQAGVRGSHKHYPASARKPPLKANVALEFRSDCPRNRAPRSSSRSATTSSKQHWGWGLAMRWPTSSADEGSHSGRHVTSSPTLIACSRPCAARRRGFRRWRCWPVDGGRPGVRAARLAVRPTGAWRSAARLASGGLGRDDAGHRR